MLLIGRKEALPPFSQLNLIFEKALTTFATLRMRLRNIVAHSKCRPIILYISLLSNQVRAIIIASVTAFNGKQKVFRGYPSDRSENQGRG